MFGIGFLHSKDIVHCDLKPDNIMVCQDTGYIKLIDFGLATVLKPGELSGDFRGTAEYMSPEMLSGNWGKSIDWWAVGIIAFELFFGATPFLGDNNQN